MLMESSVSIAFVDLCGFSRYTRLEGDRRATAVARSLEDHIRCGVRDRAEVVKTLGDGALVVGDEVSELVRLTTDIIAAWQLADELPLRGVVASGPAISEGGDLYGDLVNSASHALAEVAAGRCRRLTDFPAR